MSGLWSSSAAMNFSASVLMPRSKTSKPAPFEHHPDQVLADVVDVALDRADDDLADRLGAGLGEERAQDRHAGLHRVGREEDLGDEQDAVAEVDADDLHARHERVVEDAGRRPAATEQDVRALDDLGGHAVVEVVVHLFGELVVGERREVDLCVLVLSFSALLAFRGFHIVEPCRMMELPWPENLSDKGTDVQSPVHRTSLRGPRRARRRPDRGDRGRRPGRPAEVDGRAAARVARPRRRRRAGPGRHALPARAAAGHARGAASGRRARWPRWRARRWRHSPARPGRRPV